MLENYNKDTRLQKSLMMLILHRIEMLQTEEWTVLYFFAWPCAVNYFRSGSKRYLHLCPDTDSGCSLCYFICHWSLQ